MDKEVKLTFTLMYSDGALSTETVERYLYAPFYDVRDTEEVTFKHPEPGVVEGLKIEIVKAGKSETMALEYSVGINAHDTVSMHGMRCTVLNLLTSMGLKSVLNKHSVSFLKKKIPEIHTIVLDDVRYKVKCCVEENVLLTNFDIEDTCEVSYEELVNADLYELKLVEPEYA